MAVYPIQNDPVPGNPYRIIPAGSQGGDGAKTTQEIGDLPGKDILFQNHSRWWELQKINDSLNEVAQKKRTDDTILIRVEDYIDRMKAELERILKNFPPFPPGSEDRIRLLRNYAGFRNLIDRLTVPAPKESGMGTENSGRLSPSDSVPGANQPGEMTPGNLKM